MNNEPPYQDLPSSTPPPPPGTGYTHYPPGQSSQGYAPQSGYASPPDYAQPGSGYGTPPGYAQPGSGYGTPEYAQPGSGYVPPSGYAQPVYPAGAYAPPVLDPGRGMAITGFVLGIVSLCLLCLTIYGAVINLIVAGLGIVFSAMGRKSRTSHGLAVAGLVMSIIAMVISFLFFLVLIGILAAISVPHSGY